MSELSKTHKCPYCGFMDRVIFWAGKVIGPCPMCGETLFPIEIQCEQENSTKV